MTREEIIRRARLLQYSSNPKELAEFIGEIADEEMEYPTAFQGLDEAAKAYGYKLFEKYGEYKHIDSTECFKAGAKWMEKNLKID